MKIFTFLQLCLLSFLLSVNIVNAQLIEQALEDKGTFCYVTAGGGSISTVNNVVRAGNVAHRHTVSTNYKRSEIDDCSWHKYDAKGNVFWYGASYYLPASSFSDDINTYVTQMRFSNIHEGGASRQNCTTRACEQGGGESGSGHHLKVNNQKWEFTLRYQDPNCADCRGTVQQKFDLGAITTNKWTDLIMEARWSHNTDGYLKIWKQVENGGYSLVVNYQGRTWFDKYADGSNRQGQDVKAPNYTVGLYYSTKTDTRVMYTDEIRVYQQQPGIDGFAMVRPDQGNIVVSKASAPNPVSGSTGQGIKGNLSWNNSEGTQSNNVHFGTSVSPPYVQNRTAANFNPGTLQYNTTYYWKINEVHSGSTKEGDVWSFTTIKEPVPCAGLKPVSVFASDHDGNTPDNAMDCDLNTRWSALGDNKILTFDLNGSKTITGVKIAWFAGNQRSSNFDIQVSTNGSTWQNVLTGANSSGTATGLESFTFSPVSASYLRYVGHGNNVNMWNSIAEFEISSSSVAVTGVSLNVNSLNLQKDQTQQLTATVSPSNATNKSVTWSSSNTAVATVSSTGLVTAVNSGTATITVTTTDGGFTATCAVTVPQAGATNLLTNGNLEDGTTAWAGNASTITSTTAQKQEGSRSISVTARSGNWSGPQQNITSILLAEGKGNYYGSAFIKMQSTAMTARVTIKIRVDGTWSYHILGNASANATSWTEVEGTKNLTWTGTLQEAWIYAEGSSNANFWMDNVWLVKGTSKSAVVPITNLALNKPITASAFQDDSFGLNPPQNLVDGDIGDEARWSAEGYPQWAEIDLGANYNLSKIELYTHLNRVYQYTIQLKPAGGSYSTLVNRSSNTQGGQITDNVAATGRYVRINVTGASGYTGSWISLNELMVFGKPSSSSSARIGLFDESQSLELEQLNRPMMYPNPVLFTDLKIVMPVDMSIENMLIYNIHGQEIYQQKVMGMTEIKVSRAVFTTGGVYLIRFDRLTPYKIVVK